MGEADLLARLNALETRVAKLEKQAQGKGEPLNRRARKLLAYCDNDLAQARDKALASGDSELVEYVTKLMGTVG